MLEKLSEMNANQYDDTILKRLINLGKKRGIELFEADIGSIKGVCVTYDGETLIFINVNNTEEKRFVLAHELGHAVLHKAKDGYLYFNDEEYRNKIEQEANRFATKLIGLLERRMCIDGKYGIHSSIEAAS